MSQRRTRYTVRIEAGPSMVEKRVIRAYSAEGAINHYVRLGYTVLSVEKGDFRKVEREAKLRAQGGHTLDQRAIKDAAAVLGLKLPVRIRQHARVGDTQGNYRFAGTHHNIMVKAYLKPDKATWTLWHELTHALQAERDASGDRLAWNQMKRQERRAYTYHRRPSEREAEATAKLMSKDYPLAR